MQKSIKSADNTLLYKIFIIVGALFFINPVFSSVDILPDCIGCVFVFFGLKRVSFFDSGVEKARRLIIYLFAVEFIKLLLTKPLIGTQISSNVMLATTAFSIAEAILYLLIFTSLFGGMEFFANINNFGNTFSEASDIKTLSFIAFFIRIAGTLIPDLIAIAELQIQIEDEAHAEILYGIVDAKPVIVILMLIISAIALIAWYIVTVKFVCKFEKEAGAAINAEYCKEFTSKPGKVSLQKLRVGVANAIFASVFAADIKIDGIRILPSCVMFLLLAALPFILRENKSFAKMKLFAPAAFVLVGAMEAYEYFFPAYDPVVIYETPLRYVIINTLICIPAIVSALVCTRYFVLGINELYRFHSESGSGTAIIWVSYSASAVLRAIGFAVPYLYKYISTPKIICSFIFTASVIKSLVKLLDAEREKASLYGDNYGSEIKK